MTEETEAERKQRQLQAFEELRKLGEELEPFYAEQKRQLEQAAANLEAKYVARGLRFTAPFGGGCPVQAYGHIDGLRFYFRYRWSGARLDVGPYERELEELHALRMREASQRHLARSRERFAAGEIDEQALRWDENAAARPEKVAEESDPQFYPHRIVKRAFFEDPEDTSGLKGDLDGAEAEAFFAELIERLEELPAAEQLPERDRVLYYEGWAAAEAWDAAAEAAWEARPAAEKEAELAAYHAAVAKLRAAATEVSE